ncbi:hypothetical protein FACS1894125_1400 [Actinomycetota bacterium]|nr:hypothetical protein FACS1894125_1400 [Actinomycetota bacterium]
MQIITSIITGMPVYAWFILVYLYFRIRKLTQPAPVHQSKQFIMPVVFMIWGLDRVVMEFGHLAQSLVVYLIAALVGVGVGYLVYRRFNEFFIKDGQFWRHPAYASIVVIILNVLVKFALNIEIGINPQIVGDLVFDIIYCAVSGFTVGLFFGGIINMFSNKRRLLNNLNTP